MVWAHIYVNYIFGVSYLALNAGYILAGNLVSGKFGSLFSSPFDTIFVAFHSCHGNVFFFSKTMDL